MYYNTIWCQQRDIVDSAMFKEDVTELEYEINSVQKDSLETIVNDRDFRKFMPSAQCLL